MSLRGTAIGVLAVACATAAGQNGVVAPNANAAAHGNSGMNTVVRDSGNPRTYQLQIAASELGSIPVGAVITGIQWRLQTAAANLTPWPAAPATWANYDLRLSQATNAVGSMSTTFASNMTGVQLVRSGSLTIPANSFPGGAVTPAVNDWGPMIAFDTPYVYQGGDVVVLLSHDGSDLTNNRFADALTTAGPGYGTLVQAVSGTGYNVATGAVAGFTIPRLRWGQPNDDCSNATSIGEGTHAWSLVGATNDAVISGACGASASSPDVWYRYVATGTGTVRVNTCGLTGFDSVLQAFDGCGGTSLACNDDTCGLQSRIEFPVTEGSAYLIRVARFAGVAGGSGQLQLELLNDACADAPLIGEGTYHDTLVGATNDGTANCGASATNPDVWYRYIAQCDQTVTVTTCGTHDANGQDTGMDTVLALFDECGGTQLACNDDAGGCALDVGSIRDSRVVTTLRAGQEVTIRCSKFGAVADGPFVLTVSAAPAPYSTPSGADFEGEACLTDGAVDTINGGCNSTPNVFGSIACGQTILGSASGFLVNGANFRDTDWYRFTVPQDTVVTYSGGAQFPLRAFLLTDACPTAVIETATNECGTGFAITRPLAAGTYIAFMATNGFGPGAATCGVDNRYWIHLSFADGCPAPCDPDVNCDGVPDQGDVACMILAVAGDMSCFCQADPDFNGDGVPDQGDVADVILVVAGAPCP